MTEQDLIRECQARGGVVGQSMAETLAQREPANFQPAMDISEKDFQAMVIRYAENHGWKCYHTYLSIRSKAGYPDLTMVSGARKRIVFAELKDETGKMSKAQQEWLWELEGSGAEAFLWRPSDWPVIMKVLA